MSRKIPEKLSKCGQENCVVFDNLKFCRPKKKPDRFRHLEMGEALILSLDVANVPDQHQSSPSADSLLKTNRLKEALAEMKPGRLRRNSRTIAAQSASVVSNSAINFSTGSATHVRSVEKINTAPTLFQHNGPVWNGSTTTAPWSGPGSTAEATVGGFYDGSKGQGTLEFEVDREGIHGDDDLSKSIASPFTSRMSPNEN